MYIGKLSTEQTCYWCPIRPSIFNHVYARTSNFMLWCLPCLHQIDWLNYRNAELVTHALQGFILSSRNELLCAVPLQDSSSSDTLYADIYCYCVDTMPLPAQYLPHGACAIGFSLSRHVKQMVMLRIVGPVNSISSWVIAGAHVCRPSSLVWFNVETETWAPFY